MQVSTEPSTHANILADGGIFRLSTRNTSLWLRTTVYGHLEQLHYGERLYPDQSVVALAVKRTAMAGTTVAYRADNPLYSLDTLPLAWSGIGSGDYRHSPAELKMPDGTFSCDFVYAGHRIHHGCIPMETLPSAYEETDVSVIGIQSIGMDAEHTDMKTLGIDAEHTDVQTLEIELREVVHAVILRLFFTVFPEADVITRRAVLENKADKPLVIRRLMSMMMDLPNRGYRLVTFDGGWIYGFNLVYSGNHYSAIELSNGELVRVQTGIHPHCFEWTLQPGERVETLCRTDPADGTRLRFVVRAGDGEPGQ